MLKINRAKEEQDAVDECVAALAESFGREMTDAMFSAYQIGLADVPVEAIEAATLNAIRSMKFMPRPVELRQLAGEMSPEDRAVMAWQAVCDALSAGYNSYDHVDFDDGLINATIRNLGGWVVLLGKSVEEFDKWAKQDFIRVYQSFMRSGVNGDVCRPLVGLSDTGVQEVHLNDGKIHWVDLGSSKRVVTGLPLLAHVERARVERRRRDDVPLLEIQRPPDYEHSFPEQPETVKPETVKPEREESPE